MAGTRNGMVRVWELKPEGSGAPTALYTLPALGGWVGATLFSPDGRCLVTAAAGRAAPLRGWNARTGRALRTYPYAHPVTGAALSPDGRSLLTVGPAFVETGGPAGGENVIVWDLETGRRKLAFPEETTQLLSIACSPDGTRMVTGGNEGALSLWDAATGRRALTLRAGKADVEAVALSHDGRHLFSFTGGFQHTLRVW